MRFSQFLHDTDGVMLWSTLFFEGPEKSYLCIDQLLIGGQFLLQKFCMKIILL